MTTQTNTTPGGLSPRLEIASRLLGGWFSDPSFGAEPHSLHTPEMASATCLRYADALLAADADSRKQEPSDAQEKLEHTEVALQQARDQRDTLRDQLARVTRELDEEEATSDYLRHELGVRNTEVDLLHEQINSAENTLADVRAQLAAAEAEKKVQLEALRQQQELLAAALAPLPEEDGLEELDYAALEWCHMPDHNPIARHALASHARCLARKAREEGRQA